ncbi:MAG: hypothetical protein HKN25_03815 [Pyrinomonadaceae bacterium]|nr:hypothetical protein [Pyrinomonadaceae bacterium]
MLSEDKMIVALNDLSDEATLRGAITLLQTNHAPKHLTATHTRPADRGYGAAFFMKRKMITTQITKVVWGKPQVRNVRTPSHEFGDYEGIDRTDEFRIVSHIGKCDFGAIVDNHAKTSNSFIFFTEIPKPYVGFDWIRDKSLPIEGGYLGAVIAKRRRNWKILTAFPCGYPYYSRMGAKVIHRRGGSWSL